MDSALDMVVFSVILILVIFAFFVLSIMAVATEERRQRRAEGERYAPKPVDPVTSVPVPAARVMAPAPTLDARPTHFVPAP